MNNNIHNTEKKETTSQKAIIGNEGEGKGDYAKVSHNM